MAISVAISEMETFNPHAEVTVDTMPTTHSNDDAIRLVASNNL